jgi:hypothetical protein
LLVPGQPGIDDQPGKPGMTVYDRISQVVQFVRILAPDIGVDDRLVWFGQIVPDTLVESTLRSF